MSVTLKEIAYYAGVDVSVVSRVLNNKADQYRISRRCQEKVKKIALELGYIPNAYAVGVKTGQFNCVALLHGDFTNKSYLPEKLLCEIHLNLEKQGKHLLLARVPKETVKEQELPMIFRSLMAEGLIVNFFQDMPPKVRKAIHDTQMPKIWLNDKLEYDAVYPDSFAAAKRATEYLIGLGHRKICYCDIYSYNQKPNAHYSAADRRGGYQQAMQEAGLAPYDITPSAELKLEESIDKQTEFFYSVLKKPERPTAMLFYWGYSIPAIFAVAARLNLQIPRDLSVITFAGETDQRVGLCSTAIIEPETDMAREAVAMLRKKIKHKDTPLPSKRLDYHFLDMKTCAKPNESTLEKSL
ncbi:MAG TPA: LacI family DNA-binding transcriptional regulator [Anaerohalosphaeraceae bacterium]|nr:LacI family DNA-binding transcriptional regulator [Anaerohalosphaeraceae bacterium]